MFFNFSFWNKNPWYGLVRTLVFDEVYTGFYDNIFNPFTRTLQFTEVYDWSAEITAKTDAFTPTLVFNEDYEGTW